MYLPLKSTYKFPLLIKCPPLTIVPHQIEISQKVLIKIIKYLQSSTDEMTHMGRKVGGLSCLAWHFSITFD